MARPMPNRQLEVAKTIVSIVVANAIVLILAAIIGSARA